MKSKSELIDNIMDNFDFSRVARCMEVLEWEWCDVPEGVPEESDIRKLARKLLNNIKEAYTEDRYTVSTGGFVIKAWYEGGKLDAIELSFCVAEWDVTRL